MNEILSEKFNELSLYFESRKFSELRSTLSDLEPADIAYFIDQTLEEKDKIIFFRLLPKDIASDVFVEFDSDTQEILIVAFSDTELKAVLNDMFIDDAVAVIEEMPANVVKRILNNSTLENRKQINEILEYPEDSAGSIMTTEFISLSAKLTVEQAFEKIRKTGVDKETIYTCYVTDGKKHLIGVVTVKELLLADKEMLIENIMDTNVIFARTTDDKEGVALKLSKYDFLALPVIDGEGCLVGIVTVDDALDVIHEEATEDIQMMNAILPTEKEYLKQSVISIWLTRMPWLLVLLISATFTGVILNIYEPRLNSALLIACIPMLMGTGGNAGSQASVTVVRALALGEIEFKDILKVLWKEIRVSVILALSLAIVCFAKLILIDKLIFGYEYTPLICAIVSLSMFATIVLAKIIGCALPLLAKKMHLDPAVVASPFITTILDVLSLMIYCVIAVALL